MKPRQKATRVCIPAYVAVVLFSMSTWMDVVGVWIEMPLFVTTLPEGWSLPSYLAIIIQLANVGPAVYAIIQKFQRGKRKNSSRDNSKVTKRLDAEVILTLVIITFAALNVFMLSFLWPITSIIGGQIHSVAMLTQMVPTALTSCMTSLVFLPYMARFPSSYISAYYMGQGFSGLVPGLIGLVQGAGSPPDCIWNNTMLINNTLGNVTDEMAFDSMMNTTNKLIVHSQKPLFSVQIFFFCLTAIFLISLAAFCALNFSKCGRSAMLATNVISDGTCPTADESATSEIPKTHLTESKLPNNVDQMHQLVRENNDNTELTGIQNEQKNPELLEKQDAEVKMQSRVFVWLLIVVGVVNALSNGLLPSTESYTCLPYGYLIYTLAVRLSAVAASLASLSSMFLPRASVKAISLLTLIGLAIATFHMILALQSPDPVLRGYLIGDIIVVVSAVIMDASFAFVRVSVAILLHEGGGRHKLLWCGGITQAGSFCGALVAFVLVSCLHVFKSSLCILD